MKQRVWFRATFAVLFLASLGVAVRLFRVYKDANTPILQPGVETLDAAVHGDPEDAMRRARELLVLMKAENWKTNRIPLEPRLLPDRYMAESPTFHSDYSTSFSFPSKRLYPEYDEEIAFYTSIYARTNAKIYKGDRVVSHPTGFYIVGWKNGDVTKVPVETIRLIPSTTHPGASIPTFPGMKSYDPKGRVAFY